MVQGNVFEHDQPVRYSLEKSEILRGQKQYQRLLQSGKTIRTGNILCRLLVQTMEDNKSREIIRAGFTVPRRNVRKAVDRNRIKRLLREAYRLNKYMLLETVRKKFLYLDILFIYQGTAETKPRYLKLEQVQTDMIRCLSELKKRITGGVVQ